MKSNQEMLTIVHTNDLHSHFEAMPRIAQMIQDERHSTTEHMLVFDIGDHMDRMALETEGSKGQANIDVMNLMNYDAVTIGNNEGLTFTAEMLEQAYAGLTCPVVCCNIHEAHTELPPLWMNRHVLLQKGSIRFGVIGATAPYPDFYDLLGWTVLDPLESIRSQVEQIRSEVDLIVILSHLGLPTDKELAMHVPGIDLILGGHTHHLLEKSLVVGETTLAAAEKFGHYLGKVILQKNNLTGQAYIVSGQSIPVVAGPEDILVKQSIAMHREQAMVQMNHTVAITNHVLSIDYNVESPFPNLLAQAVRRFTQSEISLVNSGQLLGELHQGDITERDLHALCPSPINPCRMYLKGEDILYSLEQSLLPEFTQKVIYGFGFRGKVLGGIAVDGIEVLYDPLAPPYERILEVSLQGVPLQKEKEYIVGTLDMFTFGIGYERLKQGTQREYILPEFLRDLLRLELQIPGAVEASYLERWIPKNKCEFM
ncbi:2',3'-cyclic-nucleotide 2'-phosphodiesterase (5'-nucleotidase family) [Paenibacillus shirakamiensis]|uniref:2',3'-cyclic-nucleotide 2'-phosphodiesterase (5'-nucleotidase family) n=1 Tax=Paenibacillus shirakamiensis TaxID=1265935 RepID=A0ABS4JLK0_9BACL|nr:2',3'-cyclic-nucleotide 2'-phosphodiesterase (5'-nucleotidase family) [Paenibacillus shirakamiensis]